MMMRKRNRFVAMFLIFALSLACFPVTASAEESPAETVSTPAYISSCADSEKLHLEYDLDVNAMHRFADSVITFGFDIFRIGGEEEYTAEITSSIDIDHNITDSTVYTTENNHAAITIAINEAPPVQNLENLIFEQITIELINSAGNTDYSIDIAFLNTQYGVFIGFIDEESLYDAYLVWLLDNLKISADQFTAVFDGRRTGTPKESSSDNAQAYSTTTYPKYSAEITYSVGVLNGGTGFWVAGSVKWADREGDLQAAKNIRIDIYDKEPIGNTLLATTMTDDTGFFIVNFLNDAGIFENGGYDIRIRAYASNRYISVQNTLGIDYYIIAECGDNIEEDVSGTAYFSPTNNTKAIFIADAINIGGKYVKAMSGTGPNSLELIYPFADEITSFYFDNQIFITSKDFASWDILLHEYGHYVADLYDIYPLVAMDHYITENQISAIYEHDLLSLTGAKYDGCRLAWQEGWANYFSIASQIQQNARSLGIAGVGNIGFDGYHMELNTTSDGTEAVEGKGEAHELAVARFLWDLTDIEGTTHGASDNDLLELGFSAVWSYATSSNAYSFSGFMYYLLNNLSNSLAIVNISYLLEDQNISATLLNISCSTTEAIITWKQAYEDEYVGNTYYLMVCDTNWVTRYSMELTTTTITLNGSLWQYLSTNFSQGIIFSIRTIPDSESSLQDSESPFETGPYHSKFKFYLPD